MVGMLHKPPSKFAFVSDSNTGQVVDDARSRVHLRWGRHLSFFSPMGPDHVSFQYRFCESRQFPYGGGFPVGGWLILPCGNCRVWSPGDHVGSSEHSSGELQNLLHWFSFHRSFALIRLPNAGYQSPPLSVQMSGSTIWSTVFHPSGFFLSASM